MNNQLAKGTRIEREHFKTYQFLKRYVKQKGRLPSRYMFYKKIAENHINEYPTYYSGLIKMERKLKRRIK